MTTKREWTETQWGVRYNNDPRYGSGYVETGGVRPGGDIGEFTEDMCRYIARSGSAREVVTRTVRYTTETSDWETP